MIDATLASSFTSMTLLCIMLGLLWFAVCFKVAGCVLKSDLPSLKFPERDE